MVWVSIDPRSGQEIARYPLHTDDELQALLARGARAASRWAERPLEDRTRVLRRLAELLDERVERYAAQITAEVGKPIAQAEAEVRKCAWAARHYAEHAPAMLAPRPEPVESGEAGVQPEPLGLVLLIMPWNYPFWQVIRALVPQLALGNTCLLKHAEHVGGVADELESLLREASSDADVLLSLRIDHGTAARVIAAPQVRGVSLTGSTRAGRAVAAAAGAALKPCVLELGGSDPFVVCADAELDRALEVAVTARLQNNGQSCIAAKRFIIETSIYEKFVQGLAGRFASVRMGDPFDREIELGPLARADLRENLHAQVRASIEAGARVVLGGELPEGPGWFYPPTILADVTADMPVGHEETFGPVAACLRAGDREHALRLANATTYGLGASVWTTDPDNARWFERRLEAGMVFVNDMVRSDPRLPFGGIKDSGYGRELGREGLLAFANVKTIWRR
ncbi:MAG: NAD-dependent succinate-semialdehyde dehydrogenase [Planctomycetota bacterium]|nr:MAG: NAD-dependent succinate-semialdehyde dehydrogenase [Planctomycetota bacterium]